MVELLSVYPTMPESAPLSSYRCGNEVRVWRYPEALAALRQVAAKAGDDSSEVGLHSLRIGAATTPAAGGHVSQRVIQREGRWKSSEFSKVYTRNNPEDAGIVSRYCISLTSRDWEDRAKAARPRYCMEPNTVVLTRPRSWRLPMVCYHWGSRSPETACASAPASWLGGELPDSGSTIGDEKKALVSRQWNPPPTSRRIITT